MAMLPFNAREVDTAARVLLPEGVYRFKVLDVTQGVSKNSGGETLAVKMEVLEGPDGGSEYNTKTITRTLSAQPHAAFNVMRLFEACGVGADQADEDGGLDDQLIVGCEFLATVTHGTYKGKPSLDLDNYEPADGTAATEEETEEAAPPPPPPRAAKPAAPSNGNSGKRPAPPPPPARRAPPAPPPPRAAGKPAARR